MSDHTIASVALALAVSATLCSFGATLRFRRIRRALANAVDAFLVDAALATELQMDQRRELGVELQRKAVRISTELSKL